MQRVLLALLALTLGACASGPPRRALDPQQVRVVGWYVDLDPRLHNVHTGITVFGNFMKPLEHDWHYDVTLEAYLRSELEKAGFAFKRIEANAEERVLLAPDYCFSAWDSSYKHEQCAAPLAALMRRHGIDALLQTNGYEGGDHITQGPGILPHVGVFTRGTDRPNLLVPYAHVRMLVFSGDPAEPRPAAGCSRGRGRDISPWPKDVAEMTAADFVWLRPEIETLLNRSAHAALVSSGLLPGPAPVCPDQLPSTEKL